MKPDELVRSVTLGGALAIGALLCAVIVCLFIVIASLTFDCWWSLGENCRIGVDEDADNLTQKRRRCFCHPDGDSSLMRSKDSREESRGAQPIPWMLRIQHDRPHAVRAYGMEHLEIL